MRVCVCVWGGGDMQKHAMGRWEEGGIAHRHGDGGVPGCEVPKAAALLLRQRQPLSELQLICRGQHPPLLCLQILLYLQICGCCCISWNSGYAQLSSSTGGDDGWRARHLDAVERWAACRSAQ